MKLLEKRDPILSENLYFSDHRQLDKLKANLCLHLGKDFVILN